MVGIISSSGLGLFDSSTDRLGTTQGLSTSLGQAKGSATVNIATGNLSVQFLDESLSGTGADLLALRTYNSKGSASDGDADRWRWAGEKNVTLVGMRNTAGSTILLTAGDGNSQIFTWDSASSTYLSKSGSGAHDAVTWDSTSSEWVLNLDTSDDVIERYSGTTGWINSSQDSSGNRFNYVFTGNKLASITDYNSNQRFDFVYDATSGKLSELRTFSKSSAADPGVLLKQVSYTYYPTGVNGAGLLSSVTTDLTPTNTADNSTYVSNYTYDANGRLLGISQSDGTSAGFTYNASGQISTVTDQTGTTTFTYSGAVTTVKLGDGSIWAYTYDSSAGINNGQLRKVESQAVNGVKQSAQYTYDADGNVATIVDGRGNTITYNYDAKGNRYKEFDVLGNTISRTFSANNHALSETRYSVASTTSPSGAETTNYVYDTAGRIRFSISSEGRVSETRYNSQGLISQTLQYTQTKYASASVALADLQAWANGQKTNVQLTEFGYDYRGNVNKKTAYANINTSGVGVLDNAAVITEYSYSEYGQLLQTIVNHGASRPVLTTLTYDGLGRQTSVVNSEGTTSTAYSGLNITVSNSGTGLTTVSTTDASGRLTSLSQSGSGTNRITKYGYSSAGQLTVTEDAIGARSYLFYDAAGRVSTKVSPTGAVTAYTYDGDGRVLTETQYSTAVTTTVMSGWGMTPPAAITPTVDAANDRKTTYTYDQAGRLSTTTVDGLTTLTNIYDGASRLVQTTQGDRITRYFYDHDGLKVGMLDAERYLTQYVYDSAGRVTLAVRYGSIQASVDQQINASFDGIRTSVNNGPRLTTYYFYDSQGRQTGVVDEQGFLTVTNYDSVANRRETYKYSTAVTVSESNTFQILENLSAVQARAGSSYWTFTNYDNYGRISTVSSQDGTVNRNVYDAAGRLTRQIQAEGSIDQRGTTSRYNAYGELTGVVGGVGDATLSASHTATEVDTAIGNYGTRYDIDGAGRRIAEYQPNGQKTLLYYNLSGQLEYTVSALGEVTQMVYNAFGQITSLRLYNNTIDVTGLTGGLVNTTLTDKVTVKADLSADKIISTTYDKVGNVYTQLDAEGFQTTNTYNGFGEQTSVRRVITTSPNVSVLNEWTRDNLGRVTYTRQDTEGANITTAHLVYDGFGRVKDSYDANNKLTHTDYLNNGRTISITDPLSRQIKTDLDFLGRTLNSYDALNNVTSYSYDDTNRKFTVTLPDTSKIITIKTRTGETLSVQDANGGITQYTYTKDGKLKTITDALTKVVQDNTYDNSGRLYETKDANGTVTRYSYDSSNHVFQKAVDPNGLNLRTYYQFDGQGRQTFVTTGYGTPEASVTQYKYDRKGQITQIIVDPNGLKLSTKFTYDGIGETVQVDKGSVALPSQQVTKYEFDKLGRKTKETIDPAGLAVVTQFSYDNNGNLIKKIDANGNAANFVYDATNQLRFTVNAAGAVSETIYDVNGNVARTTEFNAIPTLAGNYSFANVDAKVNRSDALNRTTNFAYDKMNRLRFTVNAEGLVSENVYDNNGNVVRKTQFNAVPALAGDYSLANINAKVNRTDILNHTINYAYDKADHLRFTVNAEGAVTENTFDAKGNLIRKLEYNSIPAFANDYSYANIDTVVATQRGNGLNHAIRYAYDTADRLRFTVNAEGAVTENVYDANNNVIVKTEFNAIPSLAGDYSFASVNSKVNRTDALNHQTRSAYDAAGRLRFSVNAEGAVSEKVYDAMGNVVTTTQFYADVALAGDYSLTNINSKVNRSNALNRTSNFVYDNANRLRFSVDAENTVSENVYDAAGNVVRTTVFNTPKVGGGYAFADLNTTVNRSDVLNRTTNFAYDKLNQLRFTVNAEGAVSENVYDIYGNVISKTDFNSNPVPAFAGDYSLNNINSKVNRSDSLNRTTNFAYDKLNQLRFTVSSVGGVTENVYDTFGNIVRTTVFNALKTGGSYDIATLNTAVNRADTLNRNTNFAYDKENRLRFTVNALGYASETTYDAFGNVSTLTQYNAAIAPANYALSTINGLVNRADTNNRQTSYAYDKANRQTFTTLAGYYDPSTGKVYGNASIADTDSQFASDSTADRFQRTIQVTYDAFGNAVANKIKIANSGNIASDYIYQYKTYDRLGREVNDIDGLGYVTQKAYYTVGSLKSITRSATPLAVKTSGYWLNSDIGTLSGRTVSYESDRLGRTTKVTQPDTGYTLSQYNAFGDLAKTTQTLNSTENAETYFYYDRVGRQVLSADPMGYVTKSEYDAFGGVLKKTEYAKAATGSYSTTVQPTYTSDGKDRVSVFVYDGLGHVKTTTRSILTNAGSSSAVVSSIDYNNFGEVWKSRDALNNETVIDYDLLGQSTKITEPKRLVQGTGVDVFVSQVTTSPVTDIVYDAFGQRIKETRSSAAGITTGATIVIQHKYDLAGNEVATQDGEGNWSYSGYDVSGKVTRQWQNVSVTALASDMSYAHTIERRFEYDKAGRQIAAVDIYNGQQTGQYVDYNGYGEVNTEYKIWGASTSSTASLMASATNNAVVNSYYYTSTGHVDYKIGADGYTRYQYDLAGRTTNISQQGNTGSATGARNTVMTYNKLGQVTQQLLPQFEATTSFGSTATAMQTPTINRTYDRWNNVLTESGTTLAKTSTYNQDNQVLSEEGGLESMAIYSSSASLIQTKLRNEYNYDNAGNLLTEKQKSVLSNGTGYSERIAVTNTYNQVGQLILAQDATQVQLGVGTAYAYDTNGNRVGTKDAVGNEYVDRFDKNGRQTSHSLLSHESRTILTGYQSQDIPIYSTRPVTITEDLTTPKTTMGPYGQVVIPADSTTQVLIRTDVSQVPVYAVRNVTTTEDLTSPKTVGPYGQVVTPTSTYQQLIRTDVSQVPVYATRDVTTTEDLTSPKTTGPYGQVVTPSSTYQQLIRTDVTQVPIWSTRTVTTTQDLTSPKTGPYGQVITPDSTYQQLIRTDTVITPVYTTKQIGTTPYGQPIYGQVQTGTTTTYVPVYQTHYVYNTYTQENYISGYNTVSTPVYQTHYVYNTVTQETYISRYDTVSTPVYQTHYVYNTVTQETYISRYDTVSTPVYQTHYIYNTYTTEDYISGYQTVQTPVYQTVSASLVTVANYSYDQAGRLYAEADAAGNNQYYSYDARSNLVRERSRVGGIKNHEYDELGHKTRDTTEVTSSYNTYPNGPYGSPVVVSTTATYEINRWSYKNTAGTDFVDYGTDQLRSRVISGSTSLTYDYSYNRFGQTDVEALRGSSSKVTYSYWANGLQQSVVESVTQGYNTNNNTSTYYYDSRGNRTVDYSNTSTTTAAHTENTPYGGVVTVDGGTVTTGGMYTYYQYDSLNRVTSIKSPANNVSVNGVTSTTTALGSLNYAYDEWGNRRHVTSSYTLPTGTSGSKDYWYAYDLADRVKIAEGVLSLDSTRAVASKAGGTAYNYDAAGRRIGEETWLQQANVNPNPYGTPILKEKYSEKLYSYNELGLIANVQQRINQKAINSYAVDTPESYGNYVTLETNLYDVRGFKTSTVANGRTIQNVYNNDGTLKSSTTRTSGNLLESMTSGYTYDSNGNVLSYRNTFYDTSKASNPYTSSSDYSYTYISTYSGFQVSSIGVTSSQKGTAQGITSNSYDSRGRLIRSSITESKVGDSSKTGNSYRAFAYNTAGQIILKSEQKYGETGYKSQNYYYSPTGGELANLGAQGVNLTPLQPIYEGGSTPGSYTVNAGDTLMGISQTLFGDANLWYLIADANGLAMGPTNAFGGNDIGRNLRIPNTDKAIGNTSANWKPYNPTDMIGDLTPSPKIVPPKKKGCNVIAMIVMVIIAVVLTIVTAGAAAMAMAGTLGSTFAAGGISAVVSASWAAGAAALVGGVSAGIVVGGATVGATVGVGTAGLMAAAAVGGFVGSVGSQMAGKAMGVVDHIDFRQAAASGLTAGFTAGAGAYLQGAGASWAVAEKAKYANGTFTAAKYTTQGYAAMGALNYLGSYGANKIAGIETHFNWSDMAVATVASVANQYTGNKVVDSINNAGYGVTANTMSNFIGSAYRTGLSAVAGRGHTLNRDDWGSMVVDSFGNALASAVVAWGSAPPETPKPKGGIDNIASSVSPESLAQAVSADVDANSNADLPTVSTPDSSTTQPVEREQYTVKSNDTISGILGTSNPKAIEAFMRANGLSSSKIIAGKQYNLPTEADYSAATGELGQSVLNSDNARVAAIAATRNAEAEAAAGNMSSFGPYRDGYRFSPDYASSSVSAGGSGSSPSALDIARASHQEYYDAMQDRAVSEGSFTKYIAATAGKKAGDIFYGLADISVALYNNPSGGFTGATKALTVNFGPDAFNGAVNLTKTVADGYSMILEETPLFDRGDFAGFRDTKGYNITPLATYSKSEQGGALLGGLIGGYGLSKFGGYGIAFEDIGATGLGRSQAGAINVRLVAPESKVTSISELASIPEKPSAYSVAYEMKLDPADFGKSRSVHFNRANASLDNALQMDQEFAQMMDELIPGVQKSVSSVGGRATPSGWTWEHASTSTASGQQGVMRLVPSAQHTPGSPFWRILHPDAGAAGGYSEWAIPNGAPKN